ncbi:MAG: hypothetical protein A2231_01505 [Candidatus Firestonebacteria bacterium RIFOXYA2_FULL_40_8]|nr:MAG: hypothetical protein A2231_01505 [Candidatus Firestonebacteria bacterium RIFOXYA2_FULL_40_8]
MNIKNIIITVFLVLGISASSFGKDFLYIMKFEKGEMFGDFNQAKAVVSLTKNNTKDGKLGIRIKYAEKGIWVGEWGPLRRKWDEFFKVTFYIFNEEKEEKQIVFRVKGAKNPVNTPENTVEVKIKLPAGKSEHIINISKELCLDGKSTLDLSVIAGYSFVNMEDEPLTIDISEFKLLK